MFLIKASLWLVKRELIKYNLCCLNRNIDTFYHYECPLLFSIRPDPGQRDGTVRRGRYVNFFYLNLKTKKTICQNSYICKSMNRVVHEKKSKNLVNTLIILDSYSVHFIGMCTYIVTVMANRPPHNFSRHRFRPRRIPYHSVAIRFKAVITRAAPEKPVIITVILQRISHPIGVPGKSFVWGKNWWTFMVFTILKSVDVQLTDGSDGPVSQLMVKPVPKPPQIPARANVK